ncbi:unnamed protein product, partial [Gulo gulo]
QPLPLACPNCTSCAQRRAPCWAQQPAALTPASSTMLAPISKGLSVAPQVWGEEMVLQICTPALGLSALQQEPAGPRSSLATKTPSSPAQGLIGRKRATPCNKPSSSTSQPIPLGPKRQMSQ